MLQLTIPGVEEWDPVKEEFITVFKERSLQLEHSLVSLSKWESKWCRPFLSQDTRTLEETIDYVRCMTITQNVDSDIYKYLTDDNIRTINEYIDAKMTATWFSDKQSGKKGKKGNEVITNELIYYWMIAYNIPKECEKWHLNRLLTLIRVCEIKNNPPKNNKMSMNEIYSQNRSILEARRKAAKAKR